MSFSLHGIGVSGGIAIGYAHLTSNARIEVPQYMLDRKYIKEELARFDEWREPIRHNPERFAARTSGRGSGGSATGRQAPDRGLRRRPVTTVGSTNDGARAWPADRCRTRRREPR